MTHSPALPARRRAVFLDVDGTYAHHGVVPAAHADAVRAARAAGHAVFLCTGRPVSLLSEHLLAAGFDGVVAGAGAQVTLFDAHGGRRTVLDIRFPDALAARVITTLDASGTSYMLESPEVTFARRASIELLARRAALSTRPGYEALGTLTQIVTALTEREDLTGVSFTKATAFAGTRPMALVAAELGDAVAVFPSSIADLGDASGELYLAHVTKATGMRAAIDRLGFAREDTIAFGDNLNDLEMIGFAGVGVAMSSGLDEVIAAADLVVPGPEHEGIAGAFADLGLTR